MKKGCLVLLGVFLILLITLGGFLYSQWTSLKKLGSEKLMQVTEEMSEEDLENIEKPEDLEELEGVEDLEELEDFEDVEELEKYMEDVRDMNPVVRKVISFVFGEKDDSITTGNGDEEIGENGEEKQESEVNIKDQLPENIPIHPALTLVDYNLTDKIPKDEIPKEAIAEIREFKGEYFNEDSVVIEYKADFPERKVEELRELKEVPDNITDDMIKKEKENLEGLYNYQELLSWYEDNLTEAGWDVIEQGEINYMYEHEEMGYFIVLWPETIIYTPLL